MRCPRRRPAEKVAARTHTGSSSCRSGHQRRHWKRSSLHHALEGIGTISRSDHRNSIDGIDTGADLGLSGPSWSLSLNLSTRNSRDAHAEVPSVIAVMSVSGPTSTNRRPRSANQVRTDARRREGQGAAAETTSRIHAPADGEVDLPAPSACSRTPLFITSQKNLQGASEFLRIRTGRCRSCSAGKSRGVEGCFRIIMRSVDVEHFEGEPR